MQGRATLVTNFARAERKSGPTSLMRTMKMPRNTITANSRATCNAVIYNIHRLEHVSYGK